MLELMEELRSRGFDFYLVTGGGAEFVRVVSRDFYGVSPEGVVGSQIDYEFSRDDNGTPRLLRTNRVVHSGPNEGVQKVPNIHRILGRRPVVAGGNSAGDTEMLEYAMTYDGPSLALLVNHDDAEREYAYESKAGTFESHGSILDTAARLGWTVASIKNDWATVFVDS
jgi:phosphoserine phosphatase